MRSVREGCETNRRIRWDTNRDIVTAWSIRGTGQSQRPLRPVVGNEHAARRERAAQLRQWAVRHVVDQVVALPGQGEIPPRVVAGDVRVECLADLHRERADATGRAVDQDPLAGPDLATSRSACSAVRPDMGTAAACSNVMLAGLGATALRAADVDSAHVPSP